MHSRGSKRDRHFFHLDAVPEVAAARNQRESAALPAQVMSCSGSEAAEATALGVQDEYPGASGAVSPEMGAGPVA